MPPNDYMSEDYVTELLKRDAKESSKKYSLIGVEALMPKRWDDITLAIRKG
jgi:hypothetical protein